MRAHQSSQCFYKVLVLSAPDLLHRHSLVDPHHPKDKAIHIYIFILRYALPLVCSFDMMQMMRHFGHPNLSDPAVLSASCLWLSPTFDFWVWSRYQFNSASSSFEDQDLFSTDHRLFAAFLILLSICRGTRSSSFIRPTSPLTMI